MSGLIKQGAVSGASKAFGPVGGAVAGAGFNLLEGGDLTDIVKGGIAGAQGQKKDPAPMMSPVPVNPSFGLDFDFGVNDAKTKSLLKTLEGMR